MRCSLVAAAVIALLLTACMGPTKPTSETGPTPPVGTPHSTEPTPSQTPPTLPPPKSTLIETSEYTGVIISGNTALECSFLFDQGLTGYWEPSTDDISRAEECIRQFIASAPDDPQLERYYRDSAVFIFSNLEEYRRQYIGIEVDGEKRIWCNAFLSDRPYPDWERTPICVLDGGAYFWQIEYDLSKDQCINFYVHGEG